MKVMNLNKKEIVNAEREDFINDIPPLDYFYIIPTRRKHDSGFKIMEIVGVNEKLSYIKKIDEFCDVVRLDSLMSKSSKYDYQDISIDINPSNNLIRIFSMCGQIQVDYMLSDFSFHIIPRKDK